MKTTKPTKKASALETCTESWPDSSEEMRLAAHKAQSLILDHELIEDARTEARLDAIYDREEREGALYRDE